MKPKKPSVLVSQELRRQAEQRLQQSPSTGVMGTSVAEFRRTVHELQVHQVELELQNEELERARDLAEASSDRYSDLYDFAPVGYVTVDRDSVILEVNLAAAQLLGMDRPRLLRRRFEASLTPAHRALMGSFLERVFVSRQTESCEVALVRSSGPLVDLRIDALVSASGRECRMVLHDQTRQKQAEEDRLVLNRLESTGLLAGGIAHDFNNLLTVILFNLELARSSGPGDEGWGVLLGDAKQAVLAARGLTQQLLLFSKRGAPARNPMAPAALIQASVHTALVGSSIRCEPVLAPDLGEISADEGQIGQVIRNLVLNAREATRGTEPLVVRAENVTLGVGDVSGLGPGDFIQITVADRGCGISREVLPRIFDPYFSTKQRGEKKGMGLGLTICHTIIKGHGGAILVESEVDRGTTFRVLLPRCATQGSSAAASSPPAVMARSGRILVVEDEVGMRRVLAATLKRMGHVVDLVDSSVAALTRYAEAKERGEPFEAVLVTLPLRGGPLGVETVQGLIQLDPEVKVIAMSGNGLHPAATKPERHGIREFLEKPFSQEALQAALVRLLGAASLGGISP